MRGEVYWKPLGEYLWGYMNHKETKFNGDEGVLERKHLFVRHIFNIGKESNRLDEAEVLGVREDDCVIYLDKGTLEKKKMSRDEFILSLTNDEASSYEIDQRQLQRWKKSIAAGKPLKLCGKMKRKLEKAMQIAS